MTRPRPSPRSFDSWLPPTTAAGETPDAIQTSDEEESQGFLNGGVESGERAAREALND